MSGGGVARGEIAAGLFLLGAAAVPTLADHPPAWETDWFRAVNDLPDGIHPPVWVVMQLGALGAAPVAAAVALAGGDRRLAGRLLAGGTAAWATAKVVKRVVARARPAALVPGARQRGQEATGLGFPSGHAGVATALTAAALASVPRRFRPVLVAAAATVAASRIYVGAHLPMDVVGGIALGFLIDGALRVHAAS